MTFEIYGGDHGDYTIHRRGVVGAVAFVQRNQKGGGYTVARADGGASYHMRHMPIVENRADLIMALVNNRRPVAS